jgi:hypothetical protein
MYGRLSIRGHYQWRRAGTWRPSDAALARLMRARQEMFVMMYTDS